MVAFVYNAKTAWKQATENISRNQAGFRRHTAFTFHTLSCLLQLNFKTFRNERRTFDYFDALAGDWREVPLQPTNRQLSRISNVSGITELGSVDPEIYELVSFGFNHHSLMGVVCTPPQIRVIRGTVLWFKSHGQSINGKGFKPISDHLKKSCVQYFDVFQFLASTSFFSRKLIKTV